MPVCPSDGCARCGNVLLRLRLQQEQQAEKRLLGMVQPPQIRRHKYESASWAEVTPLQFNLNFPPLNSVASQDLRGFSPPVALHTDRGRAIKAARAGGPFGAFY